MSPAWRVNRATRKQFLCSIYWHPHCVSSDPPSLSLCVCALSTTPSAPPGFTAFGVGGCLARQPFLSPPLSCLSFGSGADCWQHCRSACLPPLWAAPARAVQKTIQSSDCCVHPLLLCIHSFRWAERTVDSEGALVRSSHQKPCSTPVHHPWPVWCYYGPGIGSSIRTTDSRAGGSVLPHLRGFRDSFLRYITV